MTPPARAHRLIDITRALVAGHPTWPGDTRFELTQAARIAAGDSVNVMAVSTSTHLGSHLDAAFHYDDAGARLEAVALETLMGPCLVVEAPGEGPVEAIGVIAHLRRTLRDEPPPPRVLLRTGEPDQWDTFPDTFRPLTVGLIEALADLGVRLVGTDAPSVDAFDSKTLPVHHACGRRGCAIVEGLALAGVTPGAFELVCLPLRLVAADASPVRAVLRTLD
jgi:arylformamidase